MQQSDQQPIEIKRADDMLRFFKKAIPGTYPLTADQVKIVKLFWDELHSYTGASYSLDETETNITKSIKL